MGTDPAATEEEKGKEEPRKKRPDEPKKPKKVKETKKRSII